MEKNEEKALLKLNLWEEYKRAGYNPKESPEIKDMINRLSDIKWDDGWGIIAHHLIH